MIRKDLKLLSKNLDLQSQNMSVFFIGNFKIGIEHEAMKDFQNTTVIEIGLSDLHKTVVTIIKANFRKLEPRIIDTRNCKNFTN